MDLCANGSHKMAADNGKCQKHGLRTRELAGLQRLGSLKFGELHRVIRSFIW
jgi:hypothetical protein